MLRTLSGVFSEIGTRKWPMLFLLTLAAGTFQCSAEEEGPAEVVRAYQVYMDKNQFEQAKELSTPAEARRLDDLQRIVGDLPPDSSRLVSRFLSMDCRTARDTAYCKCEMEDQEAAYDITFRLRKIGGTWKMDTPVN